MPKTLILNEKPQFVVNITADSTGIVGASCLIQHDGGGEYRDVDAVAASSAAVSPLSGQGITLTAAQIRAVWKQLLVQALAQAKAAGGWT